MVAVRWGAAVMVVPATVAIVAPVIVASGTAILPDIPVSVIVVVVVVGLPVATSPVIVVVVAVAIEVALTLMVVVTLFPVAPIVLDAVVGVRILEIVIVVEAALQVAVESCIRKILLCDFKDCVTAKTFHET
jgi:hypothetical protein